MNFETARHEAGGHALMSYLLGAEAACRVAPEGEDFGGTTRSALPRRWHDGQLIDEDRDRILLLLAAGAAADKLAGRTRMVGSESDRAKVKMIAGPGEDAGELWGRAVARARMMLRPYRQAAYQLTRELAARGMLTGLQVRQIVEANIPPEMRVPLRWRFQTAKRAGSAPSRQTVPPGAPPATRRAAPPPPVRLYAIRLLSGREVVVKSREEPRLGAGILTVGGQKFNWAHVTNVRAAD